MISRIHIYIYTHTHIYFQLEGPKKFKVREIDPTQILGSCMCTPFFHRGAFHVEIAYAIGNGYVYFIQG